MSSVSSKPPWYVAGLAFQCAQCGRCCAGPEEGYVWIDELEIATLASFLGISQAQVKQQYIKRVGARFTIIEDAATNDCIFLQADGLGGKGCSIYEVRPAQCRTWPFWPSNLSSPRDWSDANRRCAGINRGKLYSLAEIKRLRDATEP